MDEEPKKPVTRDALREELQFYASRRDQIKSKLREERRGMSKEEIEEMAKRSEKICSMSIELNLSRETARTLAEEVGVIFKSLRD